MPILGNAIMVNDAFNAQIAQKGKSSGKSWEKEEEETNFDFILGSNSVDVQS